MNLMDKYIYKGAKTASRIIDGEAVVILLRKKSNGGQKMVTLERIGTEFWRLLGEKKKLRDIIKQLTKELGLDYEEVKDELLDYILRMEKEGVVDIFDVK